MLVRQLTLRAEAVRTRRPSSIIAAIAALSVGLGIAPGAQGTPQDRQDGPAPAAAAGPNVVRLDAIVTDREGRPALDLTLKDFQLRDDGVLQTIQSVELEMAGRAASPSGAALPPIQSALDEQTEARRAGTRLLALFLDEYHVSAGANTIRVRDALARFVDEQIRPGDLVVVMKPLDPLASIRLTRDRDALREAIGTFAGRKGDYAPQSAFERDYMSRAPDALEAVRAQVVLSALNTLAAHLGGLREGRKALVVVSEGVADNPPAGGRLPDVRAIARTANRFNVAVYAVDPRADAAPRPSGGQNTPEPAPERGRAIEALRTLADETGGEMIADGSDLGPGLRRVAGDLDAYYLLTYRPSPANDGRLHTVQLQVTRRNAQVRARQGYWAPLANEALLARSEPSAGPARARSMSQSALIRPWFGMARGPAGRTRVTFTWEPGRAQVDGRRPIAAETVVLSAATADGTPLFHGRVAAVYAERTGEHTPPERAVFDAPPGRVELDMTIQAEDDRVLDSDARDIEVLDLGGARTVMGTPEVLRTRTAREFLAVSADPDAPPVVSREFSRRERLVIRVPIYGPAATTPVVSARLLTRSGQPLREVAAMPAPARDGVIQFDLPLAALAVGEYSLEVVATSAAGRADAVITFRVTD
jgi:VWFA-related protein